MGRGDIFFAGLAKTALREKIRERLKAYAIDEVFEDELISDLIAQKHYYCSINALRPTHFRKRFRPGSGVNGYDFEGLFLTSHWRKVSWTQCLDPKTREDIIETALRDAVQSIVAARKTRFPVCEKCGQTPSTEIDHVSPEFAEIARYAMDTMTQEDLDEAISNFDWWKEEPFALSKNCPAMLYTFEAHKTAQLQAVCKECHLSNAKERRAARTRK
ncbi:hypothetical protein [Pseudomonas sp. EA_105y_Pfl2_R69]|uniref:hypothetical protein n=1 Tax=Pseudomonas sp. EA_105y_Pfl2_R69 TaxID=3088683 RepID=UPI0030D7F34B